MHTAHTHCDVHTHTHTDLLKFSPPPLLEGVDSVSNNRSSVLCFVLSGQEFDCVI